MQQIARSIALAYNNLPRPHRVMLGSLTVITLAVSIWRPFVYQPNIDSDSATAKIIPLDNQQLRTLVPEASEPLDQPA
ncbi:murein DD-endopeptidase MepM, partial [Escherichia coli]|nr:murein DD-endopeptidase MepM [Escherichia coli]